MSAKFIVGVSAIVERDGDVLLLRRSATKDHAPGEWETGSGRVEYGERPEEAIAREIMEETKLHVEVVAPVATFSFRRGPQREEAIGIVFWCRHLSGEVELSDEHDTVLWATPAEASRLVTSHDLAGLLKTIDRLRPCL